MVPIRASLRTYWIEGGYSYAPSNLTPHATHSLVAYAKHKTLGRITDTRSIIAMDRFRNSARINHRDGNVPVYYTLQADCSVRARTDPELVNHKLVDNWTRFKPFFAIIEEAY